MGDIIFKSENARLITRTSADRAGLGDYTTKRNFRRELDQCIRREGYDYFWPNTEGDFAADPGDQPFPWKVAAPGTGAPQEAIRFIGRAERPNGEHAILAGSKTRLWRYVADNGGGYFVADAVVDDYVEENTAQWILIGSGFSALGHRWEHHNIDGSTILNNGVDLPVSFRIEDNEVKPLYELRDQGIASVGTIGEINGILMACDISEIQSDAFQSLMRLPGDIVTDITVSQSGTTVTVPADFFVAGAGVGSHTNTVLVRDGLPDMVITAVTNARMATVDTSQTIASSRFILRYKASQTGATFSGIIIGTAVSGNPTVTATSSIFNIGMVGKIIRFSDGFTSEIASYNSGTIIDMVDAPTYDISGLPFWITDADFDNNATVNDKLTTLADFFTSDMVGRTVIFDTGETRVITKFIDSKNVKVDIDFTVASTLFRLNNETAYSAFTDTASLDRIQYRTLWSMPNGPRRFAVSVPANVDEGGRTVTLQYQALSFSAGDEVTIIGAGESGGNLSTTILSINGPVVQIADSAATAVEGFVGSMIHTDAIGSIVGYEDLQDDSSAILRALKLGKRTLVIYKGTSIFLCSYTGLVEAPFTFEGITIPESVALRYRWSLIDAGGMFHIYAGSNSFYKFDLSTQRPQVIPQLDLISDIFYGQVDLSDQENVFSADNAVSNEVFIWFPSETDDKAICFDYKHETASTIDFAMTGAGSIKKPSSGAAVGATEGLFLMGNTSGTILIYGRADSARAAWSNEKEIFYRRSAYPFSATKTGITSTLISGLGDFGAAHNLKTILRYVLYLASQSENAGVTLSVYGTRNPSEPETLLFQDYIRSPRTENMISCVFRNYYFRYKISIDGINNPLRISAHGWDANLNVSKSNERRQS